MFLLALAFLALAGLEIAFFAGEDSYRDDGTSNWDAYEGAHFLVVAAVVLCVVTALLALLAGVRRLPAVPAAIAAVLAIMVVLASLGSTLN